MLMEKGVNLLSNNLPKVISPKTHAIIDYAVVAGGFFTVAGIAWKSHRGAAIASLICGIAETSVAMMTNYPGGVAKVIDFPTHGKIDAGFAGVVGAMPNLMGFTNKWPASFFRTHAIAMAAVTGMTDFTGEARAERGRRYRAA
ncbi:MAG TPA: hypothetical protein VD837_14310 [Terriglobales bacterium]|nr:hypothetical protein [Terriglobales bacterium]